MTDTAAIEEAIRQWVVEGSGLDDGLVFWEAGKPRPAVAHICMAFTKDEQKADGWTGFVKVFLDLDDGAIVSVDDVANTLEITAHEYKRGDGPVHLGTTGTAPDGLAIATDYWVIVDDVDHIKLATTFKRAMAGQAIDILDEGTGDHEISTRPTTRRQGEELLEYAQGINRIEVQLQCFAQGPTGGNTARAILSRLARRSSLTANGEILNAAGVGLIGFEPIQATRPIVNTTVFEPRAITVAAFHITTEETSVQTVIEQLEVTSGFTGTTYLVPPDES